MIPAPFLFRGVVVELAEATKLARMLPMAAAHGKQLNRGNRR